MMLHFNPCFLGFQHMGRCISAIRTKISILVFLDFNTWKSLSSDQVCANFNPCFLGFQPDIKLTRYLKMLLFQSLFSWISTHPHKHTAPCYCAFQSLFSWISTLLFSIFCFWGVNFNPCFLGFQLQKLREKSELRICISILVFLDFNT